MSFFHKQTSALPHKLKNDRKKIRSLNKDAYKASSDVEQVALRQSLFNFYKNNYFYLKERLKHKKKSSIFAAKNRILFN